MCISNSDKLGFVDCEIAVFLCEVTNLQYHYSLFPSIYRAVDPRVNILEASWSPFRDTPWLLPLLVDLSDWRTKLSDIEKEIFAQDTNTDVVFVADFPGTWEL